MTTTALVLDAVYKKFRRGELHDSLRDFIPAVVGKLFRGQIADMLTRNEFWALQDVSFQVAAGEAFGIIGGNGAGKSTILKILSGIMRPTRGTVRVHGRLSALIEVGAGFHPDLTGRENIYLNGMILGMSRSEVAKKFDAIVSFSELEEFIDTPVKRYSSGMYARLGFSVAAHVEPDVLIVDEVLSVGDYLFQQRCMERMNEIMRSGTTVIFVSHNLRAVATLCSRSLLLERGRVLALGPSSEVMKAYLTRDHDTRAAGAEADVRITRVEIQGDASNPSDARVMFRSEEWVEILVEVTARKSTSDISVVIAVVDENQYHLFDTCTQRLGVGPISLEAGEQFRCAFRIQLRLAEGTYHVNAYLHRYVTNTAFDRLIPAATFFVAGTPNMRGVANLSPSLVLADKTLPSESSLAAATTFEGT